MYIYITGSNTYLDKVQDSITQPLILTIWVSGEVILLWALLFELLQSLL